MSWRRISWFHYRKRNIYIYIVRKDRLFSTHMKHMNIHTKNTHTHKYTYTKNTHTHTQTYIYKEHTYTHKYTYTKNIHAHIQIYTTLSRIIISRMLYTPPLLWVVKTKQNLSHVYKAHPFFSDLKILQNSSFNNWVFLFQSTLQTNKVL